jgi:outer membrane protein
MLGLSTCLGSMTMAQDTLKINFQDAISLALDKNLDYQVLDNNQEILKHETRSAWANHLPSASINSSFLRQTGQQFQQIEGEIVVTKESNQILSPGLSLNLPVFNGGRRILDTQSAILSQRAGEKGLERAKQQVVFDVARRYMQVLLDQELLRIAQENVSNQKQLLLQMEGFVEAGLRTVSDLYNQQAEVARVESLALDAELALENDRWLFVEYLQLDVDKIPVLENINEDQLLGELTGQSMDQLYRLAMGSRPDLQQQSLIVDATKKDYQAIKAMMLPRLNGFYNYGTFYTSLDTRSVKSQLLEIYPQNTFGLSLGIPVFNAFQSRLDVTRGKIAYENQVLRQEALDRKLYQEVQLAYQNYQVAKKKVTNASVRAAAAKEAQFAVSERFRLGLSDFLDLSVANQTLVNAQSDAAQAHFTLFFQGVLMNYALGTL